MKTLTLLTIMLAAPLALGTFDAAVAKRKPERVYRNDTDAVFWSGIAPVDRSGNPVVMKGYRQPKAAKPEPDIETPTPMKRSDRPSPRRGSSSFVDIPPPVPSRSSPNSPPPAALVTQPAVQPYNPPPINSFGDRATNAIHAYPLQGGLGNNPVDQQQFIRQRANQ